MSDLSTGPVRTRFAPSPTGLPHLGNIRTALFSWLLARHHGGQFLFRLEDTDRERYNAESEQALKDTLRWLGMDYDEGPDVGGPFGPYVQSERLPHYHAAVEQLIASGHAYRCYCSRERLQEVREARQQANIHPFGYDRRCRSLSEAERAEFEAAGTPSVVRFAIPLEGDVTFHDEVRGTITYPTRELDDHVLLKSDGFPTYHLAHMVDDHLMRITHVVRSEEWLPSAPRHVLQYRAMGWEMPKMVHPGVIQGRDPHTGKVSKLSKRHGAVSVGEYQVQGYLPEALLNYLALLGWAPGGNQELMSRDELIAAFSLSGINAAPSVFDIEKLNWMNGVYIRALPSEELVARALPYLQQAGLVPEQPDAATQEYVTRVLKLEQERLKLLSEAPAATEFFFREEPEYDEKAVGKWLRKPEAPRTLDAISSALAGVTDWSPEPIEAAVRGVMEQLGVKPGEVIHPTRVAATGRTVGPGLFETLWALGKERVLARLRLARERYAAGSEG
ncbi:MAG: glutamate--tRNA ligase [Armatimonadota bacterium]